MFFYIYDSFLSDKKYEKILNKIETRLINLGIAGRIVRLSILKNIEEIIKDLEEKDATNIIIVGEDKTFFKAAKSLAGRRIPLGFIPIKNNSNVARLLGLPINKLSCDVISGRLIETVSLGKINEKNFLSFLEMPAEEVIVTCDHQYLIKTNKLKKIRILNLGLLNFDDFFRENETKKLVANSKDDRLEIIVGNPAKRFLFLKTEEILDSLFCAKEIEIINKKRNKKIPIIIDGGEIIETPVRVSLSTKKVRLIVGRDRII